MNLYDLCYDSCVKIAHFVFLDGLVEPEVIAFSSILDEVFETTLSNCSCIHQIFFNCWWYLDLWWKTNKFFTMLKWILSTFDDTAAMHNFLTIFNPCFAQILQNIFSCSRLALSLKFAVSPVMNWLGSIHLWTAPPDVLIPIISPDPCCSLLIVCTMTWQPSFECLELESLKSLVDNIEHTSPFVILFPIQHTQQSQCQSKMARCKHLLIQLLQLAWQWQQWKSTKHGKEPFVNSQSCAALSFWDPLFQRFAIYHMVKDEVGFLVFQDFCFFFDLT